LDFLGISPNPVEAPLLFLERSNLTLPEEWSYNKCVL